ncbi:MAG: hypothetical protein ABIN89_07915 [Chitinophagaceae bacterium]
MNKQFLWLFLVIFPALSQAQLNNIMKRTKAKIENRVDNKIDNKIDKKMDEVEGKEVETASSPNTESSKETTTTTSPETVKSFSKFDFVPGERIIYAEDSAQDAIWELPLTWNSSGKEEVMTRSNKGGNWLRMFQNNTCLTGNKKAFGENYTIEFDLM